MPYENAMKESFLSFSPRILTRGRKSNFDGFSNLRNVNKLFRIKSIRILNSRM